MVKTSLKYRKSKKNIPNQKDLGLPILEFLKDMKSHHIRKISKFLETHFELSEEEKTLQK